MKNNLFIKISIVLVILFGFLAYQQLLYRVFSPDIKVSKFEYAFVLLYPTVLFLAIIGILSLKKIQNLIQDQDNLGQIFIISGIIVLILLWSYHLFMKKPPLNSEYITSLGSWILTCQFLGWSLLLIGLWIFKKSRIFIENNKVVGKIAIIIVILFFFLNLLGGKYGKYFPLSSWQEDHAILVMKIALTVYISTYFLIVVGLLNRYGLEWLLSVIALISQGLFAWSTSLGISFIFLSLYDGFFFYLLHFSISTPIFLFFGRLTGTVVRRVLDKS